MKRKDKEALLTLKYNEFSGVKTSLSSEQRDLNFRKKFVTDVFYLCYQNNLIAPTISLTTATWPVNGDWIILRPISTENDEYIWYNFKVRSEQHVKHLKTVPEEYLNILRNN